MLMVVLSYSQAFSQTKVGVRIGMNNAKFQFDEDNDSQSFESDNFNINFSVPVEIQIDSNFYIQPEFSLLKKGFKSLDISSVLRYEAIATFNYIDIPINFKYKVNLGRLNVFALAGPYVGYALDGKLTYKTYDVNNIVTNEEEQELDFEEDEYARLELGVGFGLGFEYNISDYSIFIDGRYSLGLSNLNSGEADVKASNKVMNIGLGAMFNF
jgi:hypothetical protein